MYTDIKNEAFEDNIIDIHSKAPYPSCALSNFAQYDFNVDDIRCSSMEGFLQSLKVKSPKKQREICLLCGTAAKNSTKFSFSQFRWKLTHKLYWQGKKINRFSDEYQILLDRAYMALAENKYYKKALKDSVGYTLIHSIGKTDAKKTVLTEYEFITRLSNMRKL